MKKFAPQQKALNIARKVFGNYFENGLKSLHFFR